MQKLVILTQKELEKRIADAIEQEKSSAGSLELQEKTYETLRLYSLQSQINPHFLYNALESIRGQAILDGAPIIAEMSQALANYFRYSISSKNDIATLREELSNVENFLKIQLFRFKNRFSVEIERDEDEDVLEAVLPKLTLQPIVENSISHGFTRNVKDAKLRIAITGSKKAVKILISDNGVGMSESELEKINQRIDSKEMRLENPFASAGIGIQNVNMRIKLLFGEEYGIHVYSVEEAGTDVEIFIPYLLSTTRA